MAFNGAERERLFRSAIAMISASNKRRGEYSLTQQLKRAYPPEILSQPQSHNAYQAIARQALVAAERGREAQELDTRALPLARVPTDPGIRPDGQRFRFRVLITATGAGGSSISWAADINSDERLSRQQLEDLANEQFDGEGSAGRGGSASIAALGAQTAVTVSILSVGQRAR